MLLPSFTSRIGKDLFEHVFSGCVINSITLSIEDAMVMLAIDVVAKDDTKTTLKTYAQLSFTEEPMLAFHEITAAGGITPRSRVRSLELAINNNADAAGGRGIGSRYPYRIPAGAREIDLSFSLWYEDDAELQRFWGGASGPAVTGATEFEFGFVATGTGGKKATFTLPRCIYTENQHQPSGRNFIEESATAIALQSDIVLADTETTVTTEMLVTVENDEANQEPES